MCTIVAPFAGAWIEIVEFPDVSTTPPVAPFAGAWIEITADSDRGSADMSLPSRERGLKSALPERLFLHSCVAPFAGAWIEIRETW